MSLFTKDSSPISWQLQSTILQTTSTLSSAPHIKSSSQSALRFWLLLVAIASSVNKSSYAWSLCHAFSFLSLASRNSSFCRACCAARSRLRSSLSRSSRSWCRLGYFSTLVLLSRFTVGFRRAGTCIRLTYVWWRISFEIWLILSALFFHDLEARSESKNMEIWISKRFDKITKLPFWDP